MENENVEVIEETKTNKKVNLPNILTVVRICLVPVFVVLLLLQDLWVGLRYIALGVFVLASLTDWVDGKIA